MPSKETKPKEVKPLDKEDFSKNIRLIVDCLFEMDSSREEITSIVNKLNSTYGIKKPIIRSVAAIRHKHSKEETEVKNKEIAELINLCS